jgi:nucleoid-associated protein YgaU
MNQGNGGSGDDMPDFSNVQSGASSTAKAAEPAFETYTIKPGDSLSKIAKLKLGNANDWPKIHEANKDTIKDPNKIFPGQVIKIPLTK